VVARDVGVRERQTGERQAAHPRPSPRNTHDDQQQNDRGQMDGEVGKRFPQGLPVPERIPCEQAQERAGEKSEDPGAPEQE
jgi:hypothetical protein